MNVNVKFVNFGRHSRNELASLPSARHMLANLWKKTYLLTVTDTQTLHKLTTSYHVTVFENIDQIVVALLLNLPFTFP